MLGEFVLMRGMEGDGRFLCLLMSGLERLVITINVLALRGITFWAQSSPVITGLLPKVNLNHCETLLSVSRDRQFLVRLTVCTYRMPRYIQF